jgi:hypothetical protein
VHLRLREGRAPRRRKITLPVDADAPLEGAVSKWARSVLDHAERSKNRNSRDPLDRTDGTEEWYSSQRGRQKTQAGVQAEDDRAEFERKGDYRGPDSSRKREVKSKDPLDHVDGMEDW